MRKYYIDGVLFNYKVILMLNDENLGGVVKVEIYEVDTKIALYVDTF